MARNCMYCHYDRGLVTPGAVIALHVLFTFPKVPSAISLMIVYSPSLSGVNCGSSSFISISWAWSLMAVWGIELLQLIRKALRSISAYRHHGSSSGHSVCRPRWRASRNLARKDPAVEGHTCRRTRPRTPLPVPLTIQCDSRMEFGHELSFRQSKALYPAFETLLLFDSVRVNFEGKTTIVPVRRYGTIVGLG